MKRCTDCKFCISIDSGYSNSTVKGTEIDCLKGQNEGFPSDHWYGENEALKFAEQCKKFHKGELVKVDVDGEMAPYTNDPVIQKLLIKYDDEMFGNNKG